MRKKLLFLSILFICVLLIILNILNSSTNFGKDKKFLQKYTDAVILSNDSGSSQVVIIPQYQGRVMTSTADGDGGISFGWINYKLISSQKLVKHMNAFGGEDRFWMGPEGGQFGLYFPPQATFDIKNWQVPAPFDTVKYNIATKSKDSILLTKQFSLKNYSGKTFRVKVLRKVELLSTAQTEKILGIKIPRQLKTVGYATYNNVVNIGKKTWNKKSGLLSIWILGNYAPSPGAIIILPINEGSDAVLGKQFDVYESFGEIPPDRLKLKNNVILFKADGKKRSKIGLNPKRAKDIVGSYDATKNILTIIKYNKPPKETRYVNSLWEIQKQPYKGDVVNAYNDGPLAKGLKPLGPFYEIETSSPALALRPGQSYTHIRYTFHFTGSKRYLDIIARQVLGISIKRN
jgi:hypothetical protein